MSINNIKLAKYAKVSVCTFVQASTVIQIQRSNLNSLLHPQWFNDSAEDIRSCCDKVLKTLQAHYGWQVRRPALANFFVPH